MSGPTIHTAGLATATLSRHDGPITFVAAGRAIAATLANVVATDRTTTLGSGAARVGLVEHLLAALNMAGFYSGVLVEVSGPELPILDGSAQPWLDAIAELGVPPLAPEPLRVLERVEVSSGDSYGCIAPGPRLLSCSVSYPHPAIGEQSWAGDPSSYSTLAPARTFGFMAEAEVLRSRGLALGAVLEHAIVFADDGPMSPLRFADEPVRHKALDAVGDLALLGRPIDGTVTIVRGSHRLHHQLMLMFTASATRSRGALEP